MTSKFQKVFEIPHCVICYGDASFALREGRFGPANLVSNPVYMMNQNPGERMGSDPIASEKVAIERKIFFLDLKENQRGRFLKITEDVGGRRDTIMLPAPAFRDFLEALQRLVEFEGKL